MLGVDVLVKGHGLVIESIALKTANEAGVVQNLLSLLLFAWKERTKQEENLISI